MSIPPLNSLPPKFSLLSLQHSLRGFAPSSHTNFLLSLPPSFPRTHIRGRRRVASRIPKENRCGNHTPSRKGIVPTSVRRATVRTDLSMSLNCYLSRRRRQLLLPSMPGNYRAYHLAEWYLLLSHLIVRKVGWESNTDPTFTTAIGGHYG